MLEPIIFPTDKSGDLLSIASIDTNNSGRDVPNPTIARPIKKSDILYFLPIAMALDNKRSAPLTTRNRPSSNIKKSIKGIE